MGHVRSYAQYVLVVFASLWFSQRSLARTSLPYCQDDRDFQHGWVVYKLGSSPYYSQTQLVAGIKRKYRCNRGYVLKGSSWSTCLAAGRWSNDPPTCEPKGCQSLRKKENNLAYVGYTREKGMDGRYPHGTSGQVFCDAGKILVAGNGFTECSAGEWVPLIPLCYDIDVVAQGREDYCPIPYIWAGQLASTEITDGHVAHGTQVDFECLPFAERASPSPITCMSGRWEPEEPQCIPKHCTLPPLTRGLRIVNAPSGAMTPHSQNLTLECSSAYILQGPPQITCWYGDWAGNIPTCDHPKTDPPPTSPRPTTVPPTTVPTTTEEPRDLLPRLPGEDYSQCGKAGDIGQKLRGRVVGGYEANEAAWPWQAAIYWQRADGSWFFFCAGTVINREWILSAGHCFGYDEDITRLQVKLGLTDRIRDQGTPREQVFSINGLYLPKEHDFIDFDYDIALLHLSRPAVLGPYVRPICLPPEITSPEADPERLVAINSFGMVIGWGHSKPVAVNSSQYTIYEDILQQLQIPVRPRQACVNSLRDVGEDETQFTINMFCAGYNRKPLDTCFGDSGGPLMRHIFHSVVGRDGIQRMQKRWVQVGIVSAGKGCAVEGQFAFYTHVPRLVNWVYSVIRANLTHTGTEIVQL